MEHVGTADTDHPELEPESTDDDATDRDIAAHVSGPDRVVFAEDDNPDGWIATDLTVDPQR